MGMRVNEAWTDDAARRVNKVESRESRVESFGRARLFTTLQNIDDLVAINKNVAYETGPARSVNNHATFNHCHVKAPNAIH